MKLTTTQWSRLSTNFFFMLTHLFSYDEVDLGVHKTHQEKWRQDGREEEKCHVL